MWLLDEEAYNKLAMYQGYTFTDTDRGRFEARFGGSGRGDQNRILQVSGDTARINVQGVMTKQPDIMALIFGGGNTTYGEIIDALVTAEADDRVNNVELHIDSAGGNVEGLFDTLTTLQLMSKPTTAIASKAASGAYALAAQADKIVANGVGDTFGSIGVAFSAIVPENQVTITSSKAPKKRPDLTTEEGRKMVVEQLDEVHDLFVDVIAQGRGTTSKKINADYGQGGTFLAQEALKRGMIDEIGFKPSQKTTETTTASTGGEHENIEVKTMDLETLKAQHPAVFKAAHDEGVAAERDRCTAHLTWAENGGKTAMSTAITACKEGTQVTQTMIAQYMTASKNEADLEAAEGDDDNTQDVTDNAGGGGGNPTVDPAMAVTQSVAAAMGVDLNGGA